MKIYTKSLTEYREMRTLWRFLIAHLVLTLILGIAILSHLLGSAVAVSAPEGGQIAPVDDFGSNFDPCDLSSVTCPSEADSDKTTFHETPTPNPPSLPVSSRNGSVRLSAASVSTHDSDRFIATVTKYTLTETNQNGGIMASGRYVYLGAAACPRKYPLGTKIEIAGDAYTCEDRTSQRFDGRFDIYEVGYQKALNFGKQKLEVTILK